MEGLRPTTPDVAAEYQPMRSCDSDDSQSNASRSEDNEAIPGIIYTSDDSADVGQSDSTYIDSDVPNYIAENVSQKMEDELSQQLLLESDTVSSHQPSPQVDIPFITHPLSPVNLNKSSARELGASLGQAKTTLYSDRPTVHLQVNPGEGLGLTRSNSTSSASSSTEDAEFISPANFLARYEPLPMYAEDEAPYGGGLRFDALLEEDTVKGRVIHDHLNLLTTPKEPKPRLKQGSRIYVGDVPIDARYQDAFFVKWNWPRIRQTCVFLNLSVLIGLLCVGIGLIVHMPKGSDCMPAQEWWQGSAAYHVFVPSFLDSDGDGFGDLSGVVACLDYLQDLGVRTVRLASVFESPSFVGPPWGLPPTNYTGVAPQIGDTRDLHLLAALLHERDMFLILDVPLARKEDKPGHAYPALDLVDGVSSVLTHWMNFGVDGFAFLDLDQLRDFPQLVPALLQWRQRLDAHTRGLHRRVMAVPVALLKHFESTSAADLSTVVHLVNLIDVRLDITQSSEEVAAAITDATRWDSHPSLPWINWYIGGPFLPRIADMTLSKSIPREIPALGFMMLQLFLPGSVTLYYGDEIGLTQRDEFKRDLSWATPMAWSPEGGGFTSGSPWLALGLDWTERNVQSLNSSLDPLRVMIHASHTEVPLYINGIFEDVGSFHPSKATNYKIRYAADNLLILDRFYPRRNKYAIVANLGMEPVQKDLSRLYYGGRVLASSHGKEGYVRFQHVSLEPREALALVLDK